MKKIPIHSLAEKCNNEMISLRYLTEVDDIPFEYIHKDDYYIFIGVKNGSIDLLVDCESFQIVGTTVYCILPGQVHIVEYNKVNGWILIVDKTLVKDKYKEVFEKIFFRNKETLDITIFEELNMCILILYNRLIRKDKFVLYDVIHSLLSACIGMIADIYQDNAFVLTNSRLSAITFQFKNLLSVNYKVLKSPFRYAYLLNITPIYLNEAVKKTLGVTVSDCIQNEILIQSKRLLLHTNLTIKEIAFELGYEDVAYFTRLFTKLAHISPSQFRKRYLK